MKKPLLLTIGIFLFLCFCFYACNSSEDEKSNNGDRNIIDVSVTGNVVELGVTYAIIEGYVNLNQITSFYTNPQIGIELAKDENCKYAKQYKTRELVGNKIVITTNGLDGFTKYYYRTFVQVNNLVYYGEIYTFTTKDVTNMVSSGEVFDISENSAMIKCSLNPNTNLLDELK